ncbi:hypothetical protein [Catenulispora pinisilvae]|uniref:hypothetical protein n=1 Tax=Catenulispora pinisilvae TaxID=2705253 RepID=UPI0018926C1E|nr:hypothetical protein [Catenulispora pinisilvae]
MIRQCDAEAEADGSGAAERDAEGTGAAEREGWGAEGIADGRDPLDAEAEADGTGAAERDADGPVLPCHVVGGSVDGTAEADAEGCGPPGTEGAADGPVCADVAGPLPLPLPLPPADAACETPMLTPVTASTPRPTPIPVFRRFRFLGFAMSHPPVGGPVALPRPHQRRLRAASLTRSPTFLREFLDERLGRVRAETVRLLMPAFRFSPGTS